MLMAVMTIADLLILVLTSDPPRLRTGAIIIIIISAERSPLLDIDLPQSSPRRSVLRCPHLAASRDLHQTVGPPWGLTTLHLPVPGRHLGAMLILKRLSTIICM
jgi:hypothetical protein